MTDYFDLTGKVALITGGSRGLGYQMAKAFAAHGADLFITSRKRPGETPIGRMMEAISRIAARFRPKGMGEEQPA